MTQEKPPLRASVLSRLTFRADGPSYREPKGGAPHFLSLTGLLWRDNIAFMAKARYHYNIMLRPEPEGGYTALVPALPGCVTYGRTVDEAREMAKDAISGYIASLRKHKDPIPSR